MNDDDLRPATLAELRAVSSSLRHEIQRHEVLLTLVLVLLVPLMGKMIFGFKFFWE